VLCVTQLLIMSFLPAPYTHGYPISPEFRDSVAYFSMEFALDQVLKIYSGGLGFLSGSHMRSAHDMGQNVLGVGLLWTYGYYNQVRGEGREMAVVHRRKEYSFLEATDIRFTVTVHGADVWVKVYYIPSQLFGTAPMFLLTTDIEENDHLSRTITHSLYDPDKLTRVAQSIVLGAGGAKLLDILGVDPTVWHLNEAHALPAAFHEYAKLDDIDKVREKFVFTTHTPEEAGNEVSSMELLKKFGYFCGISDEQLESVADPSEPIFNHTLGALRMSRKANAVSKLHGEVSRKMWIGFENVAPITHITNGQNKRFWADEDLDFTLVTRDLDALALRKRELKIKLFKEVADQTGRFFDPDVLTIVWARRFAGYKRPSLITQDLEKFAAMLASADHPVQVIWAGKPYPMDFNAIEEFNALIEMSRKYDFTAVLVGYELGLSRKLKGGADIWLNNPVVTREASGTSGMTAAMNGAINLSTFDGWVCEYAVDGHNSFIIPPAEPDLSDEDRDYHDCQGFYKLMHEEVLPKYYSDKEGWLGMMVNSMMDVAPMFDSDRMAAEYYTKMYAPVVCQPEEKEVEMQPARC